MFSFIWHTFFFDPVYNTLVFFIDVVPGGDVGVAIVCTTLLIKALLLPLSLKASRTQFLMRHIEPQLKEIRERLKDKREQQAHEMLAVYKNAGINPLSSIALLFVQVPIVIALYFAVFNGGGTALPGINTDILYSFIPAPLVVSMLFVGLVDIAARSLPLAALAGITQYVHTKLSLPPLAPREPNTTPSLKDDFTRSMHLQMRYVMPLLIFVVAYMFSGAIALYFTVSNLAAIAQEYVVRRERRSPATPG